MFICSITDSGTSISNENSGRLRRSSGTHASKEAINSLALNGKYISGPSESTITDVATETSGKISQIAIATAQFCPI